MSFPPDIKGCMKDCILSVMWPRQDIVAFFRSCNCTTSDLRPILTWKEENISRSNMIDLMFARLDERADNGIGQFRAMLQRLFKWDHFDPYYFEKLQKLDKRKATANLTHLRQLQEIRDGTLREERRKREEHERQV